MKKIVLIVSIVVLAAILFSQELQYEAVAINIEVPVRVFKGDVFVDDLALDDFELYEDGVLQKIDAVYLIKKTTIEREESSLKEEEARQKFAPKSSERQFILVFEVIDYSPRLAEIIDYFFDHVFAPGDKLAIVTPRTTYHLRDELFANKPINEVSDELKEKLRKDVHIGNAEYKSILREIIRQEATYDDYLRLKSLRRLEEKKLLDFAEYLKNIEGQKNVFLLYQRDAIPVPRITTGANYVDSIDLHSAVDELGREISFDVDRVKQAFSDSEISAHFIYITNTEQYQQSIENQEASQLVASDWSYNTFGAFYEVAKATGGLVDSSANPAVSFQKASDATENYYLLYYTPKDYKADGKFKEVKVKVKGKSYKITHRAGYFAD